MTTPRATPGERRHLTVIFCDLVGSTVLSQRLDPEELLHVMQAYRRACSAVVADYDGHVAQWMGDGLMAYFGWPAAHEDDAERAVRAGLEIAHAVARVAAARPLAVRIGVATGPVVVGGSSGVDGEGLAVGETPNLASRLQHLAEAGEVIVAHSTRRLVGDVFELADLGAVPVRGMAEPVRAWRALAVRPAAARFAAAHGSTPLTPLVGRAEELALLLRHWSAARRGTGCAVLLGGEPGIGKSRLAAEFRERIANDPHATLQFQCSPFHLNAAFYPIITHTEFAAGFTREDTPAQKLDKLERILTGDEAQRAEAAPLLAALLSLPVDRYAPIGLSPLKQKQRTLEVLAEQVEAVAYSRPVLLIFEDAHWIDPSSHDLLDALVPRLSSRAAMLVLTYRPQQYTPHWTEAPHVTTLTLAGLETTEGLALAESVARGTALPAEALAQLVAHADGVPLFIEELTKSVLESQLAGETTSPQVEREPMVPLSIPATLSASLVARLGRLQGARELAQIGACIGRAFSYELLLAVSARSRPELDSDLERLTDTELVFRHGTPPDATYTFKHALVQDAAYDSLLKSKRQQLHARIADVLEHELPQSVANQPELLAHHRTLAGHLFAAIPLWRRAGEAALRRVALQEGVAYLEKGLALIERLPASAERDSVELSLREPLHSARLRWRGWAAPEVRVNATEILELAQRQDRPQSLLVGLWGMWINTITQGRVEETTAWARRLLDEGQRRANLDLSILGHRAQLSSHFYLGALQEACDERNQVLALYDPARAGRWMALTGNDVRTAAGVFASQSLWMLGYPDQAVRVSDQKDEDSRRLGDPFDLGWALTWGTYLFDYRCEPDRLLARIQEADRLAREQEIPVLSRALVPAGMGLALLRLGHLPEATRELRRGIEGWRATGGHLNLPYLKSALAEAMAKTRDYDGALGMLDECLDQIRRPGWGEQVWLPETLRLKGWVLVQVGRRTEAEAQLRASLEWAQRQRARSWELRAATTLAELLIACGRRDAARELLAPIHAWFTEGVGSHDHAAAQAILDELGEPATRPRS